jgi:hypothetical protein
MSDSNQYGRHLREVVERHQSLPPREQRSQIRQANGDRPAPSNRNNSQRKERG